MTWPMLNLQAEYGFRSGFETDMLGNQGEPRDNMISLQAAISLPIFSRGQQKSMARSMDAMQKSNTLEAEQLQRDTESALRSLFERAVRLQRSIDLYAKRILPTSEDAYRSALSGFSASRSSFSSLLSFQIAILNDKTTLTQLRAEFARTLAEVARYTTDPSQWESASTADSKG
jgi:outer membrane protein TolC